MNLLGIGIGLFALGFLGALVLFGFFIYRVHLGRPEPEGGDGVVRGWATEGAVFEARKAEMQRQRRTQAKFMIAALPFSALCAAGVVCIILWVFLRFGAA